MHLNSILDAVITYLECNCSAADFWAKKVLNNFYWLLIRRSNYHVCPRYFSETLSKQVTRCVWTTLYSNLSQIAIKPITQDVHVVNGYVVKLQSNGLVVKALDSQSRGPVFRTSGWVQGQLSLSSFQGR